MCADLLLAAVLLYAQAVVCVLVLEVQYDFAIDVFWGFFGLFWGVFVESDVIDFFFSPCQGAKCSCDASVSAFACVFHEKNTPKCGCFFK